MKFPEFLSQSQITHIKKAIHQKKPILVTGKSGPTGKTTLTKWLRDNGIEAYEKHEMEEIELNDLISLQQHD